jgi:ligand-binding sensor domain-containing protein
MEQKSPAYLVQNGSKTVNLVSMHKDHQGVLWLGTIDHGAFKWDGKEFKRFNP